MKKRVYFTLFFVVLLMAWGCTPSQKAITKKPETASAPQPTPVTQPKKAEKAPEVSPVMVDKKGYRVKPVTMDIRAGLPYMPVGAEVISKDAPVRLDEGQRLRRLEVRDLAFRYPGSDDGVTDISFDIDRNSFTVITGKIGSGKTSLSSRSTSPCWGPWAPLYRAGKPPCRKIPYSASRIT